MRVVRDVARPGRGRDRAAVSQRREGVIGARVEIHDAVGQASRERAAALGRGRGIAGKRATRQGAQITAAALERRVFPEKRVVDPGVECAAAAKRRITQQGAPVQDSKIGAAPVCRTNVRHEYAVVQDARVRAAAGRSIIAKKRTIVERSAHAAAPKIYGRVAGDDAIRHQARRFAPRAASAPLREKIARTRIARRPVFEREAGEHRVASHVRAANGVVAQRTDAADGGHFGTVHAEHGDPVRDGDAIGHRAKNDAAARRVNSIRDENEVNGTGRGVDRRLNLVIGVVPRRAGSIGGAAG